MTTGLKIAYVAAGAGNMYCGSCIRDNALVSRLREQGHDALLLPIYTPLRTDEESVSYDRVFFGAINIYLQQKSPAFSRLPRFLRRWLDSPRILRRVGVSSGATNAKLLGELTLSMLRGEDGRQSQALDQLIRFLRECHPPDIVHLTNSMLVGMARRLRQELPRAKVVTALQGEDIFLNDLEEPYKSQVLEQLRERARDCDLFIATSEFYAAAMSTFLDVPRERVRATRLGVTLDGLEARASEPDGPPWVLGFLGRLCPEKGLHLMVEAFRQLADQRGKHTVRLRVAGFQSGRDHKYVSQLRKQLADWGLSESVEWLGEVDRAEKFGLLRSAHVVSLPTTYRDPKGLPVLEAMASGVPVVQPNHGAFPEVLERAGGGILVEPNDPGALAAGIASLLDDPDRRRSLAAEGVRGVREHFSSELMASDTLEVYYDLLGQAEASEAQLAEAHQAATTRGVDCPMHELRTTRK